MSRVPLGRPWVRQLGKRGSRFYVRFGADLCACQLWRADKRPSWANSPSRPVSPKTKHIKSSSHCRRARVLERLREARFASALLFGGLEAVEPAHFTCTTIPETVP